MLIKKKINSTDPDLVGGDAVVRVVDEQVDADGPALAKFGRRQQTDAAEQLQLAPSDRRRSGRRRRQEPIQQIDGQREHLLLAVLLLGHLQKQSTTHKASVSYANFFYMQISRNIIRWQTRMCPRMLRCQSWTSFA